MRYIIVLLTLLVFSCQSTNDHGHSHDEAGGHSHANDQEEFAIGENDEVLLTRHDSVQIIVPAGRGVEYKFFLKQYEKLTYEWVASVPLHSDFHGEPEDYEQTQYFESYVIGTADKMRGMLTFPFAGSHGWYWKNTTNTDVTVSLKTEGNYSILGLKQ
ncbi:MAG: hypothetical protein JXQ90_03535 [Cyclobacteriaceae bacterium]